ncbi:MAG: AAA family ATPase, partial [Candidatus Woesearchaeota archaeon]|nr:AAA family ATPase [Candidatus Woesearchaeota archaeon]
MTRINKLVMEGFKSFAKRTELLFDDKFNVVVGPNGSGKSNVLDALCFVLGRRSTKSLRAEKTANLIYNGGKIKNPSSKAEVSIFFDNADKTFPLPEKEIKITRIAKQNGQSVYRINDGRATLQQLIELLSSARIDPDGYNIVLQGDVDHLIEMSSSERRQVVEEIAGISVYEDKKEKAMSELGRVEERLREAEIVLAEREANLKELKNDRDQALKYKEMKDKIDQNKATYFDFQIKKKQKDIERIEKRTAEMNGEIEEFKKQVVGIKSEIDERKKLVEKITREIEEKGEKDELSVNKEVEGLKVTLATNSTKIDNHKKEIAKIEERILSL